MIESLAERISIRLKNANPEETTSVEVMKFALTGVLHNSVTIFAALVVGGIFGHFADTLLTIVFFMTLRLVSGGYHFKSALHCFIFSFGVFVAIPFISITDDIIGILLLVSLLLATLYAPSNITEHIRVNRKFFPLFKLLSLLIIALDLILWNPIIALAVCAQSLTLIRFNRKRGEVK